MESGTPCAGEHGHNAHVGHEHVRLVEAARGDQGVDVAAVELPPPLVVSVVVEDAGSANWVGPKTSRVPSKKKVRTRCGTTTTTTTIWQPLKVLGVQPTRCFRSVYILIHLKLISILFPQKRLSVSLCSTLTPRDCIGYTIIDIQLKTLSKTKP